MRYKEAQAELQKGFDHQQTVSVPKLKRLFQSLNISVKKPLGNSNEEISYLQGEISRLKKENKRLKRRSDNEFNKVI
ncbi:hypothetical protein IUK39_03515 [Priestia aryabhattai]|uniref:hypothetical protein n=1 Tax=Priestia aryabhattai TaxID=412384 RepID=UPI001C0CD3FF|nr:hypothetical protein [Priestia aryabhattai]MBU3569246.1 hypothetical protein [Priestia aryabhattai]